jgi:hypothetical protein
MISSADLIDYVARRMAVANHGGEWAENYTEERREFWRLRAREIISIVHDARIAPLSDETARAGVLVNVITDRPEGVRFHVPLLIKSIECVNYRLAYTLATDAEIRAAGWRHHPELAE